MKTHEFTSQQWLPARLETIFPFFADAANLQEITPPWLDFRIATPQPLTMRVGAMIDYRLKVHGLPLRWRSEITAWDPPHRFVDEQRRGPYQLWRHEHLFEERDGGTLITDHVCYAVPGGALINWLFVRHDIARIFAHRTDALGPALRRFLFAPESDRLMTAVKTFLLAGCTSGIGLETLKALRADGHRVIAAVRYRERLAEFPDVETIEFDAENAEIALALSDAIDGLAYFPGTIMLKSFRALKDADFRRDLEINFFGAMRFIRAALPSFQKSAASGSIVLFSTVAARLGLPFHTSVAAAKGALESFARALAAELAPRIRVNCIAPSLTHTPLAASLIDSEQKLAASRERHPLKRIGEPAEVAQLVRFLFSDAAGFITGQVLPIDGGLSSLRIL